MGGAIAPPAPPPGYATGDVYILQHLAFLIFQSLCIVQMMRQNA